MNNLREKIESMQLTHIHWAEYFEANPEKEKEYVATGEWDNAKEHRRIVKIYDEVLLAIAKASQYDCAMAQTKYCEDCKAPLLEEEIRRLTYPNKEVIEKASQWDKVFEELVVEEKCEDSRMCLTSPKCKFDDDLGGCSGTVSRPLTEEEKVEVLEILVKRGWTSEINGIGELVLKQFIISSNGARVIRKV